MKFKGIGQWKDARLLATFETYIKDFLKEDVDENLTALREEILKRMG